jgi:hypothetical protein
MVNAETPDVGADVEKLRIKKEVRAEEAPTGLMTRNMAAAP